LATFILLPVREHRCSTVDPFSKKISLLRLHGFIFVVCEADIIFVIRFWFLLLLCQI